MASILNAATSGGLISSGDTSGILKLQTASTDAVTITASQNVGIGTTSPSYKLQVAGTIASSGGNSIAVYGKTNSDSISNTLYIQNSDGSKAANFQLGTTGILQTWVYGGSSWVNATTIDSAGTFILKVDYQEQTYTANSTTAITLSLANGTVQIITLTGNCTFTFPTAVAGKSFLLLLRQDATGSRTATWPATVKWPAGTAPTITATASKQDIISFVSDGTNWYGAAGGQNYTV